MRSEQASTPGMALRRFAAPEPARRIALVRRSATAESDWFGGLARILSETGQELISAARQSVEA